MLKGFKVIAFSVRALCADLLVYFSLLSPNQSMGWPVTSEYSQCFHKTCFENVNLLQHGWHIKEQFVLKVSFASTYKKFHP